MAASHSASDTAASAFAVIGASLETGLCAKTDRLIVISTMTARTMIPSLAMNTAVVPLVVASVMNSNTPDIALTQKPAHMIGNSRRRGSSGICEAAPSRRRSTTALAPTSTPSPNVWSVSTAG